MLEPPATVLQGGKSCFNLACSFESHSSHHFLVHMKPAGHRLGASITTSHRAAVKNGICAQIPSYETTPGLRITHNGQPWEPTCLCSIECQGLIT